MKNIQSKLSIIHCDMDAFYAAVEQRDHAHLRGKPVIIGGDPHSRGVVSTCSYEARRYGVHSAMSLARAYQLCPEGIFIPVDMPHYIEVSQQIMTIFYTYTPAVEILSIDEAFLDVAGCERIFGPATEIGINLKTRIKKELGLTASVGVSYNKFLAKLGSDLNKPDGYTVIPPENTQEILAPLPIRSIWGMGPKTSQQFERLGIRTIGDLQNTPEDVLIKHFKDAGKHFYLLAHGIDERPLETDRHRKSLGREYTFASDVDQQEVLEQLLYAFTDELSYRLRRAEMKTATVSIKLRYKDFKTITRSQSISPTDLRSKVAEIAVVLLDKAYDKKTPVRLIGLSLENLVARNTLIQDSLFADKTDEKSEKLDLVLDSMRTRFGKGAIKRAGNLRQNSQGSLNNEYPKKE
jgi:DNA polymerase-4